MIYTLECCFFGRFFSFFNFNALLFALPITKSPRIKLPTHPNDSIFYVIEYKREQLIQQASLPSPYHLALLKQLELFMFIIRVHLWLLSQLSSAQGWLADSLTHSLAGLGHAMPCHATNNCCCGDSLFLPKISSKQTLSLNYCVHELIGFRWILKEERNEWWTRSKLEGEYKNRFIVLLDR